VAATVQKPVHETTYSRLSRHLYDRPVAGNWLTGVGNRQQDTWLTQTWLVSTRQLARGVVRYAAKGQNALLINGQLVDPMNLSDGTQLRMYDVTAFLHRGPNQIAIHLLPPLYPNWSKNPSQPLSAFLDGWVENRQGEVSDVIQTDQQWSGYDPTTDQSRAATPIYAVQPRGMLRTFQGYPALQNSAQFVWRQGLCWLAGIGFATMLAWGLGRYWVGCRPALSGGTQLLIPTTIYLLGLGLLRHRFAEGAPGLWMLQRDSNLLVLLGAILILLLTLVWTQWQRTVEKSHQCWLVYLAVGAIGVWLSALALNQPLMPAMIWMLLGLAVGLMVLRYGWLEQVSTVYWYQVHHGSPWRRHLILAMILAVGLALRGYRLGFSDLDSDENTSYDATRGILRTGAPIATSGIWYTRGPVFHYVLAAWLQLVGDSMVNARWLSVIFGVATILVAYHLTYRTTGKVWIALLVALLLAIDPWELWYSRFIRFYQLVQLTTLLAVWAFIRGFIDEAGRRYQHLCFGVLTVMLLTQEVSLTLLPSFLLGYLFLARPFRLSRDWSWLISGGLMMVIFAFDIFFFKIKCLTPWTALSASTDSYLKPHLLDVTGFFSCVFIGPGRLHILYTFLLILGLGYFLKRQNRTVLFLYGTVLISLLMLTLLTYQIAERYAYGFYPIYLMLSVYSAICLTQAFVHWCRRQWVSLVPVGAIATLTLSLLLVANLELPRIVQGYGHAIGRRNTQIFEYIQAHRQPGDVVVSPTPSFGPVTIGAVDYFLMGTWYFDATYWQDGRLLDRWGGGVIINSVDQFEHVLETSGRVWIHVDDARQSRLNAQMLEYIQTLGKPVYDTFGTSLRLWDPADGWLPHTPSQGKELGAY
jgi:hypothetical protein